jgi:hypothetical protein
MDLNQITTLVSNYGFPMFVAGYMLFKQSKDTENMREILSGLKNSVDGMKEAISGLKGMLENLTKGSQVK